MKPSLTLTGPNTPFREGILWFASAVFNSMVSLLPNTVQGIVSPCDKKRIIQTDYGTDFHESSKSSTKNWHFLKVFRWSRQVQCSPGSNFRIGQALAVRHMDLWIWLSAGHGKSKSQSHQVLFWRIKHKQTSHGNKQLKLELWSTGPRYFDSGKMTRMSTLWLFIFLDLWMQQNPWTAPSGLKETTCHGNFALAESRGSVERLSRWNFEV